MKSENPIDNMLATLVAAFFLSSWVVAGLGILNQLSLIHVLIISGIVQTVLLTLTQKTFHRTVIRWPALDELGYSERWFICLAIAAYGIMAINALRYTSFSSDTMWYHLPMVAEWIKSGSIAPVKSIPLIARGYPGAREAILTWLSLPLTSDNLALLFLLEVPATFLVIFALCREFKCARLYSLALATLLVVTPVIQQHATKQKNDLFLTLTLLLTIYFIIRMVRTRLPAFAILAGASGSLAASTKYSGPFFVAAVVAAGIPLLFAHVSSEKDHAPHHSHAKNMRLISLVALTGALSCLWYIRNLVYFNNPLFPMNVTFLGKVLFLGPMASQYLHDTKLHFDLSKIVFYSHQYIRSLGVAAPLLAIGPFVVFGLVALNRINQKFERFIWLSALPVLFFILYVQQPFSFQKIDQYWNVHPRFLLPCLALLHLSIGGIMVRQNILNRSLVLAIAVASVMNMALWTHYWLYAMMLAGLGAAVAPLLFKYLTPGRIFENSLSFGTAVGLVLILAVPLCKTVETTREANKVHPRYGYSNRVSGWGQISEYVYRNVTNSDILVLGSPMKFPLYGKHFTNDLFAFSDNMDEMVNPKAAEESNGILHFAKKNHISHIVGFAPLRVGEDGEIHVSGPAATRLLREKYPDRLQLLYTYKGSELLQIL